MDLHCKKKVIRRSVCKASGKHEEKRIAKRSGPRPSANYRVRASLARFGSPTYRGWQHLDHGTADQRIAERGKGGMQRMTACNNQCCTHMRHSRCNDAVHRGRREETNSKRSARRRCDLSTHLPKSSLDKASMCLTGEPCKHPLTIASDSGRLRGGPQCKSQQQAGRFKIEGRIEREREREREGEERQREKGDREGPCSLQAWHRRLAPLPCEGCILSLRSAAGERLAIEGARREADSDMTHGGIEGARRLPIT